MKNTLCGDTLKYILNDFEERLKILEEREQTSITLGRINEIQLCVVYLQQKLLEKL